MWKIIQSFPRGIRNGISSNARRNRCLDEDKELPQNVHQFHPIIIAGARNYGNHGDQKNDQRFRTKDDCWSYLRKNSLWETLGWGAAFTAGMITAQPMLLTSPQDRGDDCSRSSRILECVAAMPLGPGGLNIGDGSRADRTKVTRSDSGFSEVQSPEVTEFQYHSGETTVSFPAVSRPDHSTLSDYSWDSSSSTKGSLYDSESARLLSAFGVLNLNPNDFNAPHSLSTPSSKDVKLLAKGSSVIKTKSGDVTRQNDVKSDEDGSKDARKSMSFAEAVKDFDEICRLSYGRYCNDIASRALKKNEPLKAVHLWLKASGAGYDKARYNLGRCYEDGIGTFKDIEKAKYYYGLAAAQGHQAAGQRLSRLTAAETGGKLFEKLSNAETAVKCSSRQESRQLP